MWPAIAWKPYDRLRIKLYAPLQVSIDNISHNARRFCDPWMNGILSQESISISAFI